MMRFWYSVSVAARYAQAHVPKRGSYHRVPRVPQGWLLRQNRIILHDNTLNLPVVARQPHPDPNYAPHTAARRVAAA